MRQTNDLKRNCPIPMNSLITHRNLITILYNLEHEIYNDLINASIGNLGNIRLTALKNDENKKIMENKILVYLEIICIFDFGLAYILRTRLCKVMQ